MMLMLRVGVVLMFFWIPVVSYAAVFFSEIAWMGSDTNANDEWIELFNHDMNVTGSGQNVEGWVLTDGDDINITLHGAMPPMSFALLERSDDNTVPGIAAFAIYTGSLKNEEGETLTLKDASGRTIAEVVGGPNWENIGGVSETGKPKKTPQQGQVGWVVGTPTPGKENVSHDESETIAKTTKTETVSQGSKNTDNGSGARISLSETKNTGTLAVSIRMPERVYVNQPVTFTAEPAGLGRTVMNSLIHRWNFGDFETAGGREVTHIFDRPGTYAVVVDSSFKEHEALGRATVTVLPVSLTLSLSDEGHAVLRNDAPHDIDVSHYTIRAGKQFEFPEHSIVLAGKSVVVTHDRYGGEQQRVPTLTDALGYPVGLVESGTAPVAIAAVSGTQQAPAGRTPIRAVSGETRSQSESAGATTAATGAGVEDVAPDIIPIGQVSAASVSRSHMESLVPYLALLLLVVVGSVFVSRKLMVRDGAEEHRTQTF